MKPKILITDKIDESAIEEARKFADVTTDFGAPEEKIINEIPKYDALIVRSGTQVTKNIIAASNLKVIGRAGVGLDNIDLNAAKEKNVVVVNAPESLTIAVTELTFGLMISLMRNIVKGDKSLREKRWDRSKFMGNELYGKTIGIVGFGRIGREVADRANAFGMKVITYDPYATVEDARESNAKLVIEIDELLKNSDVISVHAPLTPQTKHLINAEKLKLMKNSAVLVNIARGGLVDTNALIDALKNKKIAGAALDVFETEPLGESPLLELENVVLTPHLGASSAEAQVVAGTIVVEKIKNILG
jgi:D-3-phosphoglycerate dehydrogenase